MPSTRRTIEVIRVGSINRVVDYPGKQVVRLRDLSGLYQGVRIQGLAEAEKALARYRRAEQLKIEDANQLAQALDHIQGSLTDLFDRMKGKRLSRINIEVWDQISGGYLGPYTTDANGTLILPTDRKFVEVLQWKIAGGGYSDIFNGERAAGTPGLYFYFPCNEGSGTEVASFPEVSGQQIDMGEMDTPWEWYKSGFFNRPALKVTDNASSVVSPLIMFGGSMQGMSTTQFLWYCSDHTQDRTLVKIGDMRTAMGGLTGDAFATVEVASGKLKGVVGDDEETGTTELASGKWYLLHLQTMVGSGVFYDVSTDSYYPVVTGYLTVWLGDDKDEELEVGGKIEGSSGEVVPKIELVGIEDDGFDEIRNLEREVYPQERADYADFLKKTRVQGKSKGELGEPGW